MRVAITGSFTITADPPSGTDPAIATSLSGVAGNLVQGNPTGSITQTYPSPPGGAPTNVFHGDISQGCVRFLGNRAIVLGALPPGEQWTVPNFGHIDRVGAFLEDNGVGGSDRARAVFFRSAAPNYPCNPANTGFWEALGSMLNSLDAGGMSFGYTDNGASPVATASVLDPHGLSVTFADAPDPVGVSVTVGSGSGFAELLSCGVQINVNAGSTANLTCGSLIAEVVTGSAEVVLGDGAVVSIPQGGVAEVSDAGDGSFTVENLGETDIVVTVGNVETTIEPGDPPLDGWVSSSAQLDKVVTDLGALIASPSTSAGTKDKLEDVAEKVDKALAKLDQSPADRQGAAGELEGAVGDLQSAVRERRITSDAGNALMIEIAEAARLLAESAIADAGTRGGSASKIDEASVALAAGDSRLAAGRFKDAVAKYKDAVSKAEGA